MSAGEPGKTVWVAECSPLEARAACQALSPDFACEVFADGASVVERISHGDSPDVLLLDWQLSDLSGAEVCRVVRALRDDLSLPILLLSARRQTADVVEGLSAGANDLVSKPYEPTELLARVETLSRVRRLHGRATEQVRSREAQLRLVTDALPVLVSFVGADERYLLVNKGYEEWFGQPQAALIGQTVQQVIGDSAYAKMGPFVRRALAGETFGFEAYGVPYRQGGARDVKVSFVPRHDLDGSVAGYVALVEDIGERRQLEEERAQLARQRAEALKHQSEFEQQLMGIASHDLRTPLNAIVLATSLLARNEDLSPSATKLAVRAQNAADRAVRMVRDLLDFTQARIGGGIPIDRQLCNLQKLVNSVVEEVEATFPTRQVTVTHEGSGEGVWDPDRVAQVAQNLVTNALKYSPPDSLVQVATRGEARSVTLTVHNLGAPISPQTLPIVFEPFQRAVATIDKAGRSVGLGLYIVRSVVDAHHGSVVVESDETSGTTFTVKLPRASSES